MARAVLERVDVAGRCIMADALHTQRKTVQAILKRGGHYLFEVKANQPTLLAQLSEDYDWSGRPEHVETSCGHGRIDVRTIRVSDDFADCPEWLNFPGARVAARLTRQSTDKKTGEQRKPQTVYLLTSLRPQQARGPELIRLTHACWAATENGVHRVRDGAWKEDALRGRKQNLPWVLALFANLALSILRMVGVKNIKQALEELSYSPRAALALAVP